MFLLKVFGIFFLVFVIFIMSGFIANTVLVWSGSIWTSSLSFSMSFMGLLGVVAGLVNTVMWVWDIF
jgi:hypothetical protein